MTGAQFYAFLRQLYILNGQPLYGNYSFRRWLQKNDGSFSFQFNGNNPRKAVPENWLIDSKNAQNRGEFIDRKWFNTFYGEEYFNDCRASIAIWLLENHP